MASRVSSTSRVSSKHMNEGTPAQSSIGLPEDEAERHDRQSRTDVSTRVVVAIAEADGIDPMEMDERLHDWVDPDALEAVVDTMDRGHVAFEMGDHRVRVQADGQVFVDGTR